MILIVPAMRKVRPSLMSVVLNAGCFDETLTLTLLVSEIYFTDFGKNSILVTGFCELHSCLN